MSILSRKWHDLTWPHKGPKFNLHRLREISVVLIMANSEIRYCETFLSFCKKKLVAVKPYA